MPLSLPIMNSISIPTTKRSGAKHLPCAWWVKLFKSSTHRRIIKAIIHFQCELSTTNAHELNSDKRVGKINHSFRILNRNYSYFFCLIFFNLIWLILYSRNIYHIHLKNPPPSPTPWPSRTLPFRSKSNTINCILCCSLHFLENIKTYMHFT